jgi:hypothetical protein
MVAPYASSQYHGASLRQLSMAPQFDMSDPAKLLKLIALDKDDLDILSAHTQDAVLKVGDLAYLPREKRFVALLHRFDWEKAHAANGSSRSDERRQTALRFERVLKARLHGIRLEAKRDVLELLAIQFDAGEAPAGKVTLVFAGGAAIQLDVECIEAELKDLGPAWRTRKRPAHPADDGPGRS